MNWTSENIKFVEKAIELNKRGFYIDSKQTVDKYNDILEKHRSYTNCPSCIKQMICELEAAYNRFKRESAISGMTATEAIEESKAIMADADHFKEAINEDKHKKKGRKKQEVS